MKESLQPGISIVVPAYNSAAILPELVERLGKVLPEQTDRYELILVNDGSSDNSWSVIAELAKKRPWVRGFCMMRNYGQHNALLAGIRQARFDVSVTMDDDLQHPPEHIKTLLEKLTPETDVVYGSPHKEPHGIWRGLASKITKIALRHALGAEAARNVSAFRVFRTNLRQGFNEFRSPFVSIDVLLTWSTRRFSKAVVPHAPRKIGKSNYSFFSLLRHSATLMTGFSIWPLQLASILGFLFAAAGILILFYVIGRYLFEGGSVPGFPFLACLFAIFSGTQMFALGIIGEYLARMHFRLLDRPAYVVSKEAQVSSSD